MIQHTALAGHVLLIKLLGKVSDQHHVQVCGAGVWSCMAKGVTRNGPLCDY